MLCLHRSQLSYKGSAGIHGDRETNCDYSDAAAAIRQETLEPKRLLLGLREFTANALFLSQAAYYVKEECEYVFKPYYTIDSVMPGDTLWFFWLHYVHASFNMCVIFFFVFSPVFHAGVCVCVCFSVHSQ